MMCMLCLLIASMLVGCTSPNDVNADVSGSIKVAGSTALQPLAQQAATNFMKLHPAAHVTVAGGGSLVGLDDVTGQKADIGDSDVYADPGVYPDPNLTDHIVCVIPFTMIVSPDIAIKSLSVQNIIDIFATRKIDNWSQLKGPDLPIKVIGRPSKSGTRATFRRYILGGRDEFNTYKTLDSSADVRNTVASTPGAISYLALSALDPKVHVNTVAIDGVEATPQNVESGRYPFWSYEHMYTLGDNGNSNSRLVTAYLNYMLTDTVQALARRLAYIPVADMKLPLVGPAAITGPPGSVTID